MWRWCPVAEPLEHAGLFWHRLERDVVAAEGPEAGPFLQGQLSQDVLGFAAGGHAWSWILAPNGKVEALVRVWRAGGDRWLLDTDRGWGGPVLERLGRFKLRTKVELAPRPEAVVVAWRGDGWEAAVAGRGGTPGGQAQAGGTAAGDEANGRSAAGEPAAGARLVAAPAWPGGTGADVLYPDGAPEPADPAQEADEAAYEAWRVAAGELRMGAELTERTIPAEAGAGLVAATVSFAKGCYTGQELVARIDSRGGHVPRNLWRIRLDGPTQAGAGLVDGTGASVGEITSAASSPWAGWVALGYLKRGVDADAVLSSEGSAARLLPLPW